MIIHYAIIAFVFLLKLHPILDGAKIVAKVEVARRLYARENGFHKIKYAGTLFRRYLGTAFRVTLNLGTAFRVTLKCSNHRNFDVYELRKLGNLNQFTGWREFWFEIFSIHYVDPAEKVHILYKNCSL